MTHSIQTWALLLVTHSQHRRPQVGTAACAGEPQGSRGPRTATARPIPGAEETRVGRLGGVHPVRLPLSLSPMASQGHGLSETSSHITGSSDQWPCCMKGVPGPEQVVVRPQRGEAFGPITLPRPRSRSQTRQQHLQTGSRPPQWLPLCSAPSSFLFWVPP